jgi:hypothetical protein
MVGTLDLGGPPAEALRGICTACTTELDVTGSALALIVADEPRGAIIASDVVIDGVEDLQYSLGEGPAIDAHREQRPVDEPALASSERWPVFGPSAAELGLGAVFAFPLRVGSSGFGALDLYRDSAGALAAADHADALGMAEVASTLLVHLQLEARPGDMAPLLSRMVDRRSIVHQAVGMVSVQLGVAVGDAHTVVRAHAFAEGRSVLEVAADVVARRLRLAP